MKSTERSHGERERVFGWKEIGRLANIHWQTARRAVLGPNPHPLKQLVRVDPLTNRPFLFLDEFEALANTDRLYAEDPPNTARGPGSRTNRSPKRDRASA